MGKHVWGYWDCDTCGSKHIRGDKRDCPNCGTPRTAETKFYLDSDSPKEYVSDAEKNSSPDWICNYCGAANSAMQTNCNRCGASRNTSNEDYFGVHKQIKEENESEKDIDSSSNPAYVSNNISLQETKTESEENKGFELISEVKTKLANINRNVIKGVAITIGVALLTVFFIWLFTPIERQTTIDSFEWRRNIEIEELRTFNESGWSLPSGARLQYSDKEIRTYRDVIDHYETKTRQVAKQRFVGYEERVVGYRDLGNGQFEEEIVNEPQYETYYETEYYEEPVYRSEPVWDTKYFYEIDRWVHDYNVTTMGYDKEPYWGVVALGGKEREGIRTQNYSIVGEVESEQQKYTLGYGDWVNLNEGDVLYFTTFRFSHDIIEILGLNESEEFKIAA